MTFARLPVRLFVCVCALGWLASVTGHSAEPKSLTLGLETALEDARLLAAQHAGSEVVRVAGDSMVPFFRDGAVLVIRSVKAEAIRPGLVVIYVNAFGETVAHRVVKRVKDGWKVQGYHNGKVDSTIVDAGNLRGVVYATFNPQGSTKAVNATRLLEVLGATPVVLAAPAR